jgi:hypothetical protein
VRALAVIAALLVACGEDDATRPSDLSAESVAIAAVIDDDRCGPAIDDAMHAMDTERPVMAAGILGSTALPAARQQLGRVEAIEAGSAEARTLRSRAVRIHRARIAALEALRDALARGPVEDEQLLDAIHASAEAERDLQALRAELATHAPLPGRDEVPGATAIRSVERVDDGDTTDEPAEHEPGASELDDALPE